MVSKQYYAGVIDTLYRIRVELEKGGYDKQNINNTIKELKDDAVNEINSGQPSADEFDNI